MMQLPKQEMVVFLMAAGVYAVAAAVAVIQLRSKKETATRFMVGLVSGAVGLNCAVLVLRAVATKAIPLTGAFESLMVLTIVLGMFYVLMSFGVTQVWFSAAMIWPMLGLMALATLVAEPAAKSPMVATPWVIFHAISMLLGSGALIFSTAAASLFLLSDYMLKQKKVMSVLGRVPNIGWLRLAHTRGLFATLLGMTLGLVSGAGLAIVTAGATGMTWVDWLVDPKIVLIATTWCLLIVILGWHVFAGLSEKAVAYATIVMLFFVIFAVVGVTLFCGTRHVFT